MTSQPEHNDLPQDDSQGETTGGPGREAGDETAAGKQAGKRQGDGVSEEGGEAVGKREGEAEGNESGRKSNRPHPLADTGKGGLLQDNRHVLADARRVERAVRNRWPINRERRKSIVEHLMRVLDASDKPSHIIAAARVLVQADALNAAAARAQPSGPRTVTQINIGSSTLPPAVLDALAIADRTLDAVPLPEPQE